MTTVRYRFSSDGCVLTIFNSYAVSKKDFNRELDSIRLHNGNQPIFNRSDGSLSREWCTHNFLFMLGLFRSRTIDTDFDYPLPWYMKVVYSVCGVLFWPFIK